MRSLGTIGLILLAIGGMCLDSDFTIALMFLIPSLVSLAVAGRKLDV